MLQEDSFAEDCQGRGIVPAQEWAGRAVQAQEISTEGRAQWEQGMQGGIWRKPREMQGKEIGGGNQRELTTLRMHCRALKGGEGAQGHCR